MPEFSGDNPEIKRENYRIGELIFKLGDEGRDFFIVESGSVEVFTRDKGGNITQLCVMNAGESLGEFALLGKKPRSASARALADSVVIRVSSKGYEQLLQELPGWAMSMMKSFVARLQAMNHLIEAHDQFIEVSGHKRK